MVFELRQENTIGNRYLAELRDIEIQKDPLRFRFNLERLGEILGFEISKDLGYIEQTATTPLGKWTAKVPDNNNVLVTVLRAGLPFFNGFQRVFDQAPSGFVGAQRVESDNIEIDLGYSAVGNLENKVVILADPMLATGKSVVETIRAICKNGKPKFIHIASVIATKEGIKEIETQISTPFKIWTCSIDLRLNENSYIVPGLGDAGDLCYGEKL